jgi:hypothetical protein
MFLHLIGIHGTSESPIVWKLVINTFLIGCVAKFQTINLPAGTKYGRATVNHVIQLLVKLFQTAIFKLDVLPLEVISELHVLSLGGKELPTERVA